LRVSRLRVPQDAVLKALRNRAIRSFSLILWRVGLVFGIQKVVE
jgi:hypothetical protein